MQSTEDFLRLVTPAGGLKLLATPNEHGAGFSHTAFEDHSDMAISAAEWDAGGGGNVYFALGGFIHRWIDGTTADGRPVRRVRTHENVGFLRALWVDLDVEAGNPRKYETQADAIRDLVRFTRQAALPLPTIVNSGGGIHAYWPFDRDVPRASWKPLATMFKQVTIALGLKADPTRTADESSVLRVPGTHNRKPGRPVREVTLVGALTRPVDVVELAKNIRRVFDEAGATMPRPAAAPTAVTGINSDLLGGMQQHEPVHLDRIIARCPQMQQLAAARGNVEEPRWYASLQLARHCVDGAQQAHALSDGHPGYSADATDRKVQQLAAKGVGPTTCARFDSLNPGGCIGCPHLGKITSPIQLGKDEDVVPAPAPVVEMQGVELELPPPPAPYARTAAGQIVMSQFDEDGNAMDPQVVYRYDLYPVGRHYDEFERRHHTRFRTYQPKKGWYEFDVPNEVLYDLRSLAKVLANNDVLPDVGAIKFMGDYIVSYTQRLQELAESANLFMQMGWRDDDSKFVVGTRIVTETGVKDVTASAVSTKAAEKFDVKGDLETWKETVAYYGERGNEALQFGFLTAFGAPLFKFTGFNGVILNMMGPSGTGKSTVLKAMNTVYGAPDCAYFQLMDTEKSFYRRVGVLNNLPIGFDEITNIDSKRLSDLCYDFTQGRERMRLTQQAHERRDTFSWSTVMLSTANASLHSRLAMSKSDASAESVRVFEYEVPKTSADPLELKHRFDSLATNYGHAGVIYLHHVLTNMESIKQRLAAMTDEIYVSAKLSSSERFWAAVIAANITGGLVAAELGLITINEASLKRWAVSRIELMRGTVREYTRSPTDVMADWLLRLVSHTLVVSGRPGNAFAPVSAIMPRGELKARFDRSIGRIYIPVSVLQELCRDDKVDLAGMRRELAACGVLLDVDRKVLGSGTEYQTGQARCWVIDAKSPLVADTAEDVATQAAEGATVTALKRK